MSQNICKFIATYLVTLTACSGEKREQKNYWTYRVIHIYSSRNKHEQRMTRYGERKLNLNETKSNFMIRIKSVPS